MDADGTWTNIVLTNGASGRIVHAAQEPTRRQRTYFMDNRENEIKTTCEVCQGTGQTCSFLGVSRFALTWEDCPICGGMGFILADREKQGQDPEENQQDESTPDEPDKNIL